MHTNYASNNLFILYRDREEIQRFDKTFYHEKEEEGKCTFACVNHRMISHFGEEVARRDSLLFDWDWMKNEYKNYHLWNPENQFKKAASHTPSEQEQEDLISRLEQKAQSMKRNKFDFY